MSNSGDSPLFEPRKVIILLALTFLATIGIRTELIANKTSFSHDEAITYLSATCHQAEYSQYIFDGRPTPASTWKAMLRPDEKFCFRRISADLGHHDIHPPLYFWLLHVWSVVVGVDVWTGPALNTIIAAFATILLYRFADLVLSSRPEALLVTFTYALNVAVTSVSGLARQYDLLILITLLIVWVTRRYAAEAKHGWRDLASFLILAGLGGLTHYHFILTLTACVVFLFVKLRTCCIRRFVFALGSLISGYLLSFVIHPYFIASVDKELGFFGALRYSVDGLLLRLMKLAASLGTYYYLIILLVPMFLWYMFQLKKRPLAARNYLSKVDWSGINVLFFAAWIGAGIIVLYLVSITPLHQMSPKYFAMAWPFLSFIPVYILRFVNQRRSVVFYLYLFPLVLSLILPLQKYAYAGEEPHSDTVLADAEVVLVDNIARGIFPRIVWQIPDDSTVIALAQDQLLDSPDHWIALLADELVYVSEISYAGTLEGQKSMVRLLERSGYDVIAVDGVVADAGTVFEVRHTERARK